MNLEGKLIKGRAVNVEQKMSKESYAVRTEKVCLNNYEVKSSVPKEYIMRFIEAVIMFARLINVQCYPEAKYSLIQWNGCLRCFQVCNKSDNIIDAFSARDRKWGERVLPRVCLSFPLLYVPTDVERFIILHLKLTG